MKVKFGATVLDILPPVKRYMNAIERRLCCDRATRVRIMTELASDFQARRDAGQTDEAIMAELGTPQSVAAEFNASLGVAGTVPPSRWRWMFAAAAVVAVVVWLVGWAAIILPLPSNSIGIIGGADGPTAVFVTSSFGFMPPALRILPWLLGCLSGFLLLGWCRRGDYVRRVLLPQALCILPCLGWVIQAATVLSAAATVGDPALSLTLSSQLAVDLLSGGVMFCLIVLVYSLLPRKH